MIMFGAPRAAGELPAVIHFRQEYRMKVFFKKAASEPSSVLTIYSSLNPIPFTLKINSLNSLPETIYTRNLSGENFIELRFCKNTKRLYEITLIAIQIDTVKIGGSNAVRNDVFYNCYIDENFELGISKPIQIIRSDESISFIWSNKISENYFYFGTIKSAELCC